MHSSSTLAKYQDNASENSPHGGISEEDLSIILEVVHEIEGNEDGCSVMEELISAGHYEFPDYACNYAMRPVRYKQWTRAIKRAKNAKDVRALLDLSHEPPKVRKLQKVAQGLQAGVSMLMEAANAATSHFKSECITDQCLIESDELLSEVSRFHLESAVFVLHNNGYRPLARQVVELVRPVANFYNFVLRIPSSFMEVCKWAELSPLYVLATIGSLIYMSVDDFNTHILIAVYVFTVLYAMTIGKVMAALWMGYKALLEIYEYIVNISFTQVTMLIFISYVIGFLRAKLLVRPHWKNISISLAAMSLISWVTSFSHFRSACLTVTALLPGLTPDSRSAHYVKKFTAVAVITLLAASATTPIEATPVQAAVAETQHWASQEAIILCVSRKVYSLTMNEAVLNHIGSRVHTLHLGGNTPHEDEGLAPDEIKVGMYHIDTGGTHNNALLRSLHVSSLISPQNSGDYPPKLIGRWYHRNCSFLFNMLNK